MLVDVICFPKYVSDVGLCLLVDILHIIQPSYVVQLRMDAGRETKHLPSITPDFVANTPGLIYSQVLLLILLLLLQMSRLSWSKPKLQGHGTTVTKRLERVDVSDCKTAEKGESS